MFKRALSLVLCLCTLVLCFAGCTSLKHGAYDKGAYIRAYLTEPIYDFDPLAAFDNDENLQIVSLLFISLFRADEEGKPQKDLVDKYKYTEDKDRGEYTLTLKFKTTSWSDGVAVNASDAQFAFRRLFDSETSHPATALFCDIKNARAILAGDDSVDHLGVNVVDPTTLEIQFDHAIDIDTFLAALCSPAVYPLRADIVESKPNWGKKTGTIVCSGPFILRSMNYDNKDGFVLERNSYYLRNRQKDALDKYVLPFRIVVTYLTDPAEQIATFNAGNTGDLQYIGYVPAELRTDASLKKAAVTDAPSTHTYYLNESNPLFADAKVRQALSLAIDRNALVGAVTYAKAADGIVPWTVPERLGKKADFRKKADSYISASANTEQATALLSEAGIRPSSYSFSITVRKGDADHLAIAQLAAAAWQGLGFKVNIKQLGTYEIKEPDENGKLVGTGMYASEYAEALAAGNFDVIALDLVAAAPDAFAVLAPFAKAFSGNATVLDETINPNYELTPHITGYDSAAYNEKIEAAFKAENQKARAALLHEAEAILMADMPAIPLVYNQNVSLSSKKLKKVSANFYCTNDFTDAKLKGYWNIALAEEFVVLPGSDTEES